MKTNQITNNKQLSAYIRSIENRASKNNDPTCHDTSPCFAKGINGNCTILRSGYPDGECPFRKERKTKYKKEEEEE